MKRLFTKKLEEWKSSTLRQPLIVRGMRQTGKTWGIEAFAKAVFPGGLVKIDFEIDMSFKNIFEHDLRPDRILSDLELRFGRKIVPGRDILFFDEIQACPRALESLRYFYEQMPRLHVIAAGSLLDFALKDISFPVGRVQFMDVYPLTFLEYLEAIGNEPMAEIIRHGPGPVPPASHESILAELRRFWLIGGMPACVAAWISTRKMLDVRERQDALAASFRQDFSKYPRQIDRRCLESVWNAVAHDIGRQIVYTRLDPDFSGMTNKKAAMMLADARLARSVRAASADGVPLGATSTTRMKFILGDLALMQAECGMRAEDEWRKDDLLAIYRGAVAEQFVGQELAARLGGNEPHWWKRDERGSTSEVDYLIDDGKGVQPIEVKSGPAGSLRSLHQMLKDHPNCLDPIVLSTAPFGTIPEQRLRFIPIYYAGVL